MPSAKALPGWVANVTAEEREQLGGLGTPQLQCLFILQLAEKHGVHWLLPGEASHALQELGVAISAVGVRNTLDAAARARPRLVSKASGRTRAYRIAQPGERALAGAVGGNVAVVRIEAGKPMTAKGQLTQILSGLKGTVRVSDPYYGGRSADALVATATAPEVRVLLGKCGGGENEAAARRALVDLTREHKNVHVRIAPPSQLPHDRFVLTDGEMILIGHGLKDIGSRESFVIRVPRPMLEDIARRTEVAFDALWSASTPVA
jgi:hypothetical protein